MVVGTWETFREKKILAAGSDKTFSSVQLSDKKVLILRTTIYYPSGNHFNKFYMEKQTSGGEPITTVCGARGGGGHVSVIEPIVILPSEKVQAKINVQTQGEFILEIDYEEVA